MPNTVFSPLKLNAKMTVRLVLSCIVLLAAMVLAASASAQTQTFNNNTNGAINGNTTCTAPLTRTFSVGNNFAVGDVDIGLRGSHTWRGDVRATLRHPDGTAVQVVNGDANNVSGDNFNWRLNDGGTQLVNTDGNTVNHVTTAVNGGFQNNFIPNNALAAFNGKSSAGTWTLSVCDIFPGADNGTLLATTLFLTPQTASFADLSLTKAVSNNTPTSGQQITYTLAATNSSNATLTPNATIRDLLPAGVAYVSHSGNGNYTPSTGDWVIGSIPPGVTRTLTINATVVAGPGSIVVNNAEIIASNEPDIDSTPGNNSAGEDDIASATFTVAGTRTPGIPPALTCPNGSLAFDWVGRNWPPGSETNNYTLAGFGSFDWSLSSPAPYLNIAAYGGAHPRLTTAVQNTTSLSLAVDFANRSQLATTTITLGEIVDGAQFTILDVDYAANDFADLVRVTGKLNGVDVIPVLTNGGTNYVIGNTAYGDQSAPDTNDTGNVIATFSNSVDTIIIEYGNHGLAPANPDGQAIQMAGNIQICSPVADLIVTKSSTPVSDPVSGETDTAFAIPMGVLRYCILITNTGSATATAVVADDTLPPSLVYNAGTLKSGPNCANAAVDEDDDAAGANDTDAVGVSFNAGTVQIAVPSLPGGDSVAVTYEATIQ